MNFKKIIQKYKRIICCYLKGQLNPDPVIYENNSEALADNAPLSSLYATTSTDDVHYLGYVVENLCNINEPVGSGSSQCGYHIPGAFVVSGNGTVGAQFNWYDSAVGGTFLGTTTSFPPIAISETTTFYVSEVIDSCESPRTPLTATVTPTDPIEITAPSLTLEYCFGDTPNYITVSAANIAGSPTKSYTYQWFDATTGDPIGSGSTCDIYSSGTYYAVGTDGSCKAKSNEITLTITALPLPVIDGFTINPSGSVCVGTDVTLSVDNPNPNYTYEWTPGNIPGDSIIVNPAVTTEYTVTATDIITGCHTEESKIDVIIEPLPPTPTANSASHCGDVLPLASVSSNSGAPTPIFNWYDASSGGNLLQTGTSASYLQPISTTTTWYVSEISANGCEGPRVEVSETVTDTDDISIINNTNMTIELGDSFDFDVLQDGFNNFYDYYWSPLIEEGSGLSPDTYGQQQIITPTLPGIYTYIVRAEDIFAGCVTYATITVHVTYNGELPIMVLEGQSGGDCFGFFDANSFESWAKFNGNNLSVTVNDYVIIDNKLYIIGSGFDTLDSDIYSRDWDTVGSAICSQEPLVSFVSYTTTSVVGNIFKNDNNTYDYLKSVVMPNLNYIAPTASEMFENCPALEHIDFTSLDHSTTYNDKSLIESAVGSSNINLIIPFEFNTDPSGIAQAANIGMITYV